LICKTASLLVANLLIFLRGMISTNFSKVGLNALYIMLLAAVKSHISEDESRLRKNLYEVSGDAKPLDLHPER